MPDNSEPDDVLEVTEDTPVPILIECLNKLRHYAVAACLDVYIATARTQLSRLERYVRRARTDKIPNLDSLQHQLPEWVQAVEECKYGLTFPKIPEDARYALKDDDDRRLSWMLDPTPFLQLARCLPPVVINPKERTVSWQHDKKILTYDEDGEREEISFEFGSLEATMELGICRETGRWSWLKPRMSQVVPGGEDCVNFHFHPHVSSGGNLCLGDFDVEFQEALDNSHILKIAHIVDCVLSRYNHADPYQKLHIWCGVPEYHCVECDAPIDEGGEGGEGDDYCDDCAPLHCSVCGINLGPNTDDEYHIAEYGEVYCAEHGGECSACNTVTREYNLHDVDGEDLCDDCCTPCRGCGEYVPEKAVIFLIRDNTEPNGKYCEECTTECADCTEIIHTDDGPLCTYCEEIKEEAKKAATEAEEEEERLETERLAEEEEERLEEEKTAEEEKATEEEEHATT